LPICERNGEKYNHIAVVICRFTKMRHFIPTKGLTAAELANAFVRRVYSLHDAPKTIISDRGTQFISEFWIKLFSRLSIVLKHSFAYYPETNSQKKNKRYF
jgi:transposase InsO family protein